MSEIPHVVNQETDPRYNTEPGLAVVPGSNLQKEMARFEQFHSKWTTAAGPGNPYTYRRFPAMLFRAEYRDGKPQCMAPQPDRYDFRDDRQFQHAEEAARRFTDRCQRIVKDESEQQRAMEDGWRTSPEDAIAYLKAREDGVSREIAHRNYDDRNLSEQAKAEITAAELEAGEPLPEIPAKRRGRPRKIQSPA